MHPWDTADNEWKVSGTPVNGGQNEIKAWTRFTDDAEVYNSVAYTWGGADAPSDFDADMTDQRAALLAIKNYDDTISPTGKWDGYVFGTRNADGTYNAVVHNGKTYYPYTPGFSIKLKHRNEKYSVEKFIAKYNLDLDTLGIYKNNIKTIATAEGEFITDQIKVRNYLDNRMKKHQFLLKFPDVRKYLLDINNMTDCVFTDRYAELGNRPEESDYFWSLLKLIYKYLPGEKIKELKKEINSEVVFERVTNYGFILHIKPLQGQSIRLSQHNYFKIDLLNRKVNMIRFKYHEDGYFYGPIFSEDGEYMYSMIAVNRDHWSLLRFPLGNSSGHCCPV